MRFHVRPFRLADDLDAVAALHRQVAWPERSAAGWAWLADNPARDLLGRDSPTGWVVDGPDGPGAFVGQFVQRFWLGDEPVAGITGFSIIAPPARRGAGAAMIRRMLAQPGAALQYTLNANARSSGLYRRHGLKPWPRETHALKLTWIVDPAACVAGRLLRGLGGPHADHQGAGPERLMNRRLASGAAGARPAWRLRPGVETVADLSDDGPLAAFWDELRGRGRVVADRSPATLRWRLADPDSTTPPVLLAFRREGRMVGWLMAVMGKNNRIEPAILDIVDLVALDDDAEAIHALARTLLDGARTMGAAKARLQVVGPGVLAALGPLGRRARREGGWGHCHARFAPDMAERLAGWAPTPFDGDYSFCLRPTPVGARSGR